MNRFTYSNSCDDDNKNTLNAYLEYVRSIKDIFTLQNSSSKLGITLVRNRRDVDV